jgi:hypothetical protein
MSSLRSDEVSGRQPAASFLGLWCLLSLLLGPIATFLIVVLGRVPDEIE